MKMVSLEKWFMNRPHHARRVIDRAEKLLRFIDLEEGQRFLEVGCGSGAVSKRIARKYHLGVTGVDVDPEMVKLAQEGVNDIPDIQFFEADATHLPFPDSDFDIVLSFGVTHHISNWLDALREISRVLKPKGCFIYWDMVYKAWMAKFARSFQHSYGITTMPELSSFIGENSLSVVHSSMRNSLIWYGCEMVLQKN